MKEWLNPFRFTSTPIDKSGLIEAIVLAALTVLFICVGTLFVMMSLNEHVVRMCILMTVVAYMPNMYAYLNHRKD